MGEVPPASVSSNNAHMSKPRIIAGTAAGRSLDTPKTGTRPSPSRLREALFSILAFEPRELFVDLYSGSGAIGLEAASRGFPSTLVELNRGAANVLRNNAQRLDLPAKVVQGDALKYINTIPNSAHIVFAAPPYPLNLAKIFETIFESGACKPGGMYIFQHPTGYSLEFLTEIPEKDVRVKRYGSNALTFVRVGQNDEG